MRPRQCIGFSLAAMAAAVLSLAGCAAGTPPGSGGASTAPPFSEPPASAPPSIVPAATSSAVPSPDGAVTYTFPDGRLSFSHPSGWRVQHEQVSASPAVDTATVYDADGNGRVNIYYSQIGDATAGPASRFVLDTEPVPGLIGQSVPTPHSSFFVDHIAGVAHYRMGLTAGLPVSPDGTFQHGLIRLGDRIMTAEVLFAGPAFATDEEAKAWYWGSEGQTLKALLMSFTYC